MKLAIVIPYYKVDFFHDTLNSLKNQTDQRFTIYIGDDNSPSDPSGIFEEFNKDGWVSQKVVYQRFDKNLGRTSLVKQWERCIALIKSEEWIWLFSDDDIAESNCVESFYRSIMQGNDSFDLYKFNTLVIDSENTIISSEQFKYGVLDGFELILNKISGSGNSFVVEYIFSSKIYKAKDGFVDFPLGWGSDDATWVKFSENKGIYIIENARVLWRLSEKNISGNISVNGAKKLDALMHYSKWITDFFRAHQNIEILKNKMGSFFLGQARSYLSFMPPKLLVKIYLSGRHTMNLSLQKIIRFYYIVFKDLVKKKALLLLSNKVK